MRAGSPGVVLAGGGTAGHVYPGIELAERLSELGCDATEMVFTGTERGTGAGIIRDAGYEFVAMQVSGLSRSRPLSNFKVLVEFIGAVGRSLQLLRRTRPSAVVGLGGYSSLPVLVAAWLLRIPRTILQEDATLGISNRVASWMCRRVAVAFPAPAGMFARRGVRVRPAVRASIARLGEVRDPAHAREELGVKPGAAVVVFVGGSLGAGPINDAALTACERWSDREDVAVIHVCGERFFEECRTRLDDLGGSSLSLSYRLVPFEARFELLLEAATVAVTRGGATTVGELAVSGTPAVVVPSSYVAANHQEPNARALESAGGCEVLLDAEIARLPEIVEALLTDEDRLKKMSVAGPRACGADLDFADVVGSVGCLA